MKLKDKLTITLQYECETVTETVSSAFGTEKTYFFRLISENCDKTLDKVIRINEREFDKLFKTNNFKLTEV